MKPLHPLRLLLSRPRAALALAALASVLASSYPVVFFGKSFVSPNYGTLLLYDGWPTLPGYAEKQITPFFGTDVGALMWHHLPLSIIERRALFHDHELPLWDRYNATGTVLLGQSQSMFGDPLHLALPILFGPGAWDLKFLAAKWLLAFGLGLLVWRAARHLPSALIVAFAADFVGFFLYRVNHPAVFSFCYAPWILYAWLGAAQARSLRRAVGWGAALVLANWAEITSGTAKEAYMLLLSMNLTGALMLAAADRPARDRLARLGVMVWSGLLFILISAPIWLLFLDAMKESFSLYAPNAFQIQPSLLIGLFDEIFYRPFFQGDWVYNPSGNFLFLLGTIACLVYLRATWQNRAARGLLLGAAPALALAFGLIPPQWIIRVPFLGSVGHIDNCFSCALILQTAVLAGIGFREAAGRLGRPEGRFDLAVGFTLLAALIFPYVGFIHTVQRSTYSYWHWGQHLPLSPFVQTSLIVLPAAAAGLALTARHMLRRQAAGPIPVVLAIVFTTLLLWRFGLHRHAGNPMYVLNPTNRVDLLAPSPAVEAARADRSAPFRVVGFESNLAPGWTGVYGLEGINGPDALMNRQYRELLDAFGFDRIWGWRLMVHEKTLAALKPYYDFLGVKYYFALPRMQVHPADSLTLVKRADLDLYRTGTAWPRAFFTREVASYRTPDDFVALIKARGPHPFAAVQTCDETKPSGGAERERGERSAAVPARDYRLTTNTTSFSVDAPGPGVIVLEEAWLPEDFRVTVNGRPAPYFRVNHAFKGVRVGAAGTYRVVFSYWPRRLTLSLEIAAAGLLGLIGTGALAWRGRNS